MTPALRDAIHANAWLLTATVVLVAATIAVERATRGRLVDVTLVRAFAEQFADDDVFDEEPYEAPEFQRPPVEPLHRPNHPACPICHGISARAVHAWPALVAQLEGEQA